jgi:hypothetical protein
LLDLLETQVQNARAFDVRTARDHIFAQRFECAQRLAQTLWLQSIQINYSGEKKNEIKADPYFIYLKVGNQLFQFVLALLCHRFGRSFVRRGH